MYFVKDTGLLNLINWNTAAKQKQNLRKTEIKLQNEDTAVGTTKWECEGTQPEQVQQLDSSQE